MPGPEDTEVDKAGGPMILSSTKTQVHRAKLNEYKTQRANLYADMECGESRRTWEMQSGKLGLTVTDVGWACWCSFGTVRAGSRCTHDRESTCREKAHQSSHCHSFHLS